MRRIILLLAVISFVLAGLVPSADARPTNRPFKGFLVGEATFPVDPDCDPPVGFGLNTHSEATGTVTHLGLTAMVSDHCTPPENTITGGQMTFVAANGDEVWATYTGTVLPFDPEIGIITVDIDLVIVGGTGRFQGATGQADMTAFVVFEGFLDPDWAATWIWEGMIGY